MLEIFGDLTQEAVAETFLTFNPTPPPPEGERSTRTSLLQLMTSTKIFFREHELLLHTCYEIFPVWCIFSSCEWAISTLRGWVQFRKE